MSVVNTLDRITNWVQTNICEKVSLKVPPKDVDGMTDMNWEYQRVKPTAFPMYVPTQEKLPPTIPAPIPSICVRYTEGEDDLASKTGTLDIELCFSTWSTGTHGRDVILPNKENALNPIRWEGEEAESYFKRNGDGWRDAHNLVDTALREIESVTNIDGILIDRGTPVRFGPFKEQNNIPDFYPFWFSWVSFTVQYPLIRNVESVEDKL